MFCLFCGSPAARLSVRSFLVCVSRPAVGCCLVVAAPPTLLCLAVFRRCRSVLRSFFLFSFFFCVVRPRCLWLSLVSGPGCPGLRRCALFALLASRFQALRALSPLSCFPLPLAAPWWLLPPSPFMSHRFGRCRSVLCAVCCAVLCVPGCGAAPRCCPLCRPMLCCYVFCCFVALVWCRCLLCRALWRCPRPGALCFAALCFAVFPRAVCSVLCVFCRGVVVRADVHRSALCCVCPSVLCCVFPVASALCSAVLRCAGALALCCSSGACCCLRLVLWCAAVCCAVSPGVLWCGAGPDGPWLSAGGVFRCRCPSLAAWSASLWFVWFAAVPCLPVLGGSSCIGVCAQNCLTVALRKKSSFWGLQKTRTENSAKSN